MDFKIQKVTKELNLINFRYLQVKLILILYLIKEKSLHYNNIRKECLIFSPVSHDTLFQNSRIVQINLPEGRNFSFENFIL